MDFLIFIFFFTISIFIIFYFKIGIFIMAFLCMIECL